MVQRVCNQDETAIAAMNVSAVAYLMPAFYAVYCLNSEKAV